MTARARAARHIDASRLALLARDAAVGPRHALGDFARCGRGRRQCAVDLSRPDGRHPRGRRPSTRIRPMPRRRPSGAFRISAACVRISPTSSSPAPAALDIPARYVSGHMHRADGVRCRMPAMPGRRPMSRAWLGRLRPRQRPLPDRRACPCRHGPGLSRRSSGPRRPLWGRRGKSRRSHRCERKGRPAPSPAPVVRIERRPDAVALKVAVAMTYCVGISVREGLVMIADTRTNAGIDNIATFRKLHVIEEPGERIMGLCTSGNLSVSQAVMSYVQEGLENPPTGEIETFRNAPSTHPRRHHRAARPRVRGDKTFFTDREKLQAFADSLTRRPGPPACSRTKNIRRTASSSRIGAEAIRSTTASISTS